MNIRVLVVDDSILFRRIIAEALSGIPGVEIVGTAANGKMALARMATLKPDLVTLDIEMPEMTGLQVLEAMKGQRLDAGVVVLSAHSVEGGDLTIRALELGAFDFLTKPSGGTAEKNREAIRESLVPLVKAYAGRREIQKILRGGGAPSPPAPASTTASAPMPPPQAAAPRQEAPPAAQEDVGQRMARLTGTVRPEMVLIGISTGGPNALAQMMPRLPATLNVPLFIVQHMPPLFTQSLAHSLASKCSIGVKEAEDGETARPDVAYIAPGGRQMRISPIPGGSILIRITDDPPENNCRPAVDYLFRSASIHFAGRSVAVIMTGMGNDGTQGLRLLKNGGCISIAQDEASCVVFGMPREAIGAGVVDVVAPLDGIAGQIVRALRACV